MQRKLTVAIDLRPLVGSPRTGVGEYTDQLTRALIHRGRFRILLFTNGTRRLPPYSYEGDFRAVHTSIPNKIIDLAIRVAQRPYLDECIAAKSGETPDVFLSPHITSAPVRRAKKVIVVHDCSFRYGDYFSFRKRYWHWSMDTARTIAAADRIIAVSEHTREELMRIFGVPPPSVCTASPGLDQSFFETPSASLTKLVRRTYHLPESFILFLGTVEPRKNIALLLDAFERIAPHCREDLVIAGAFGWKTRMVTDTIRAHPSASRIHCIGYVDAAHKNALYRLSSCFVYPSLYEGFGFPPLEAMSCGIPVIVSHTTSLPEAVGQAALGVDPYNYEDLAQAIITALTDARYRDWCRAEGPRHAAQFSWEKTAREVADVIEEAARGKLTVQS